MNMSLSSSVYASRWSLVESRRHIDIGSHSAFAHRLVFTLTVFNPDFVPLQLVALLCLYITSGFCACFRIRDVILWVNVPIYSSLLFNGPHGSHLPMAFCFSLRRSRNINYLDLSVSSNLIYRGWDRGTPGGHQNQRTTVWHSRIVSHSYELCDGFQGTVIWFRVRTPRWLVSAPEYMPMCMSL